MQMNTLGGQPTQERPSCIETVDVSEFMHEALALVIHHTFVGLSYVELLHISMAATFLQKCVCDTIFRNNRVNIKNALEDVSQYIQDSQLQVRIMRNIGLSASEEFTDLKKSTYLATIDFAKLELGALQELSLLKQVQLDKIISRHNGASILKEQRLIKGMPTSLKSDERISFLILNSELYSNVQKSVHVLSVVEPVFNAVQGDLELLDDSRYLFIISCKIRKVALESLSKLVTGGNRCILEKHYEAAGSHYLSKKQPNAADLFLQFISPMRRHQLELILKFEHLLRAENTEEARSCLLEIVRKCYQKDFKKALHSYFMFFASYRSQEAAMLAFKRVKIDLGVLNCRDEIVNLSRAKEFAQIFLNGALDSCNFSLVENFLANHCKPFEYDEEFTVWKKSFKNRLEAIQQKQINLENERTILRAKELMESGQTIDFLSHIGTLHKVQVDQPGLNAMVEALFAGLGKEDPLQEIIQAAAAIPISSVQLIVIDALFYKLLALQQKKLALNMLFFILDEKEKYKRIDSFLSNLRYPIEERQMLIEALGTLTDPVERFNTICLHLG